MAGKDEGATTEQLTGAPLDKPRWEMFAQHLAAGMPVGEAYRASGFRPDPANASRLSQQPAVKARIAAIMTAACTEAVSALTYQHLFIQRAWKRIAQEVAKCSVADATALRSLIEGAVKAQQDVRVQEGGVSDRTAASNTTQLTLSEEAAAAEMSAMLAALSKRTARDDTDADATKH